MTEPEWLVAAHPDVVLGTIPGDVSQRKLRLFGCACCRHVWDRLPDPNSRAVIECAERFADGTASRTELTSAGVRARMPAQAREWSRPNHLYRYTLQAPVALANP